VATAQIPNIKEPARRRRYGNQEARPAEASEIHIGEFWPRVEILRAFVLSELRRILHFAQNRVETQKSAHFHAASLPSKLAASGCGLKSDVGRWRGTGRSMLRPYEEGGRRDI
jgi:hypothetical protein